MIKVNMHDAKTHLSAYLARLREGESIVLCRRNTPVAEIRLLPEKPASRRPIGLAAGTFNVPPSFFEPLPERVVRSFSGEAG
jgi:antitoxin (DNA-binding transcriptional repressor) of toxin-antitoxin stability system